MAELANAETTPTSRPLFISRLNGWFVGLVLLLLAVLVFLAVPLDSDPTSWVAILQKKLSAGGPYGIVALLGGIVGLAEISSTFPNYPREALRTRWARLLIVVNVVAAALAFWIAQVLAPDNVNSALLVVGVGVGFQALIRTQFTLAKQLGGSGGDITFNMGWLYDQFQNLCKTQIDQELMQGRRAAVTRLLTRYPTLSELHGIATYTVTARVTLKAEEQKARLNALDALLDPKAPVDLARANLALRILENGGYAYVDLLLQQTEAVPSGTAAPDSLMKQLVETCSLSDLVNLTKRLTTSSEMQGWVEQAAKSTPDATEASQKAAIAQRLVKEFGVDTVRQALVKLA
jgi:hypothetical protein